MRALTNKELTEALRDPWAFCLSEIRRRQLTSAYLSTVTGASRSGLRTLYRGGDSRPNYTAVLMPVLNYLLDTRSTKPVELPAHKNRGSLPAAA